MQAYIKKAMFNLFYCAEILLKKLLSKIGQWLEHYIDYDQRLLLHWLWSNTAFKYVIFYQSQPKITSALAW